MNTAVGVAPKHSAAVAALAGLDSASSAVLQDCFLQFGIQTVVVGAEDISRLGRQHFDACVLSLDERASDVLSALRQSAQNAHAVIYGICGSLKQAMRFAPYGINALFLEPVERQAALRVVRSTHLLVLRELRRYVRVPLVSEASLQTGTESVPASTVEISSGGACIHTRGRLTVPQDVQVTLQLPGSGELSLRAVVCWIRREEELAGLRFEAGDPGRLQLRQWVDGYLPPD